MELEKPELLDLLYYMRLTRSLEERLEILLKQGRIIGGLFRSLGQEGTAVGSAWALEKGDVLSPLMRDLGAILVKGATPREVFAQYLARATGLSGGREHNIHFTDLERGFIGTISPLGDLIAVMNGVLLAARLRKKKTVGMVYIGDGGTSTGTFHEAANFAAVQYLPLVLIVENNGYAYSTPTSRQMRMKDAADRALAYGMPSEIIDGNDVIAVYEASRRAVDRARSGQGPTLIEAKTFRMRGHAAHDNQAYVSPELLEQWRKMDPIERLERRLLEEGSASGDEIEETARRAQSVIDESLAWAESQPPAQAEKALGGAYSEPGTLAGESRNFEWHY